MTERERERVRRHEAAAILVLLLGSTQLLGYLGGAPALRGLGAISGAAPLPKVFSAHRGVETFAWRMTLCYRQGAREVRAPLPPAGGAGLVGPYNRRNVYGAVLSYGPLIPAELRRAVAAEALQPGGSLRAELGVPPDADRLRVELASRTPGDERVWVLDARECRLVQPRQAPGLPPARSGS